MKKLDDAIFDIDRKIDRKIQPLTHSFLKYFPILSVTFFLALLLTFFFQLFYNKSYFVATVINGDVKKIVTALNKIDAECCILSIREEKNFVDFLNIEKFTSSEVGCLNLAYPNKWKGPYLFDNPSYKGHLYEIVKTKEGFFVIPGNGVKLPTGLRIGKDFKVTYDSSVVDMLKDSGNLNYKGYLLGAKLEFKIGDWKTQPVTPKKIEEINSVVEEFNAAMPFAQNKQIQSDC